MAPKWLLTNRTTTRPRSSPLAPLWQLAAPDRPFKGMRNFGRTRRVARGGGGRASRAAAAWAPGADRRLLARRASRRPDWRHRRALADDGHNLSGLHTIDSPIGGPFDSEHEDGAVQRSARRGRKRAAHRRLLRPNYAAALPHCLPPLSVALLQVAARIWNPGCGALGVQQQTGQAR